MDVRQEDRKKNTCPSRGLGLAAAAIGVGVGAALYYFCSRRSQNPDGEGSTSHWSCEQPNTLPLHDDSSFITISEHSTTDTSIISTDESDVQESDESTAESRTEYTDTESSDTIDSFDIPNTSYEDSFDASYSGLPNIDIDIDTDSEPDADWDVTNSSIDVPTDRSAVNEPSSPMFTFFAQIGDVVIRKIHRNQSEDTQLKMLRERAFRERSWSLEECSICFDVMLKDQEVTKLPCTHNFHSSCIAPWLQEQQTCPYCRKSTE